MQSFLRTRKLPEAAASWITCTLHYIHTYTHTQVSLCPRGYRSHKELYSLSFHHAECILLCHLCEALLMKTVISPYLRWAPLVCCTQTHSSPSHTHTFFLSSLLPPHHLLPLSPHQPSIGFKWTANYNPTILTEDLSQSLVRPHSDVYTAGPHWRCLVGWLKAMAPLTSLL